jgi:hypothetical protein
VAQEEHPLFLEVVVQALVEQVALEERRREVLEVLEVIMVMDRLQEELEALKSLVAQEVLVARVGRIMMDLLVPRQLQRVVREVGMDIVHAPEMVEVVVADTKVVEAEAVAVADRLPMTIKVVQEAGEVLPLLPQQVHLLIRALHQE